MRTHARTQHTEAMSFVRLIAYLSVQQLRRSARARSRHAFVGVFARASAVWFPPSESFVCSSSTRRRERRRKPTASPASCRRASRTGRREAARLSSCFEQAPTNRTRGTRSAHTGPLLSATPRGFQVVPTRHSRSFTTDRSEQPKAAPEPHGRRLVPVAMPRVRSY